ncbi:HD domain-containing phosphohydrolase [Pseudoteredinibacter isoporae]|uniref:Response regulator RpfG family c-di-GMP phosphodiesterase n=1 Tax=Pseudoteredinibacter isoporae TaxID=570281 RepID=A0A7X0MU76_9GAMM|nr:HD domain-containing phosphohydrolase [Pseudoteredinibacter isoporae]MBB6520336.1 response regulator RpfG family c-di-GMP phosphodiesterase [Pseudoteredinibacter isoporae]NHO85907.1 response regulator [Pseudoteredinibacter isoporae]NIB25641.1 response regulator [Pseudoteredinibacter isoporae]
MKHSVLLVDDEPNVLRAFRRNLREEFDVHVAESGPKGLEALDSEVSFSVIVSDMQMPDMNGIEFLEKSKDVQPNAVRVMLTGNADQQTAIDAINQGNIFRFINKPSTPQFVSETLHAAIQQYKLTTLEDDLLENTLRSSIEALSETLALASPEIFGRTSRLKDHVTRCVKLLGVKDTWRYEALSMLCLVGLVSMPDEAIKAINQGQRLDANYVQMYNHHPELAHQLISKIPRMEDVANSIRYQNKNFNGSGFPDIEMDGSNIPVASRLLKVIIDFDHYESLFGNSDIAMKKLEAKSGILYDPKLIELFKKSLKFITHTGEKLINISELDTSMTLARDVETEAGTLLLSKGIKTSDAVISRLNSFQRSKSISDMVFIVAK